MERSSGHAKMLTRACLLAVTGAAASVMGALPVSAADQVNQERLLNVDKEPATGSIIIRITRRTGSPV